MRYIDYISSGREQIARAARKTGDTMGKQYVLAAWIAGGMVWLGTIGGMAMLDDGVPLYHHDLLVEHVAEDPGTIADAPETRPGNV